MDRRQREEEEKARRRKKEKKARKRKKEKKARRRKKEKKARRPREEKEKARSRKKEKKARRREEKEKARSRKKEKKARSRKKEKKARRREEKEKARSRKKEKKARRQREEEENKGQGDQPEQTTGDQGDEDEESDSEGETEEEEENRRQSGQFEHTGGDQGDDEDKERDLRETNQTPPGTIRIGLLNVRSMENKTSRISELITRNNLDVFLTAETWLTDDTAVRVLREASPEGFRFHSQVRADGRRGGGVANQFSEELQGERIYFDFLNMETFEFVVTELQRNDWDQSVVIINLYHPPRYNQQRFRMFLSEFQSLLKEAERSFIVAGDFNIHVNKESESNTKKFTKVLDANNLMQHVDEPTHRGGNTLDLVLTRNVEISDLSVRNDGISDHYTVYFNAKPKDTEEN